MTQPAVSQAMARMDAMCGGRLFSWDSQGAILTDRGRLIHTRVRRAIGRLDASLSALSPRLVTTASMSQLDCLVAVVEAESFTLAARRLKRAQPTVHRAVTQLEREAGRPLFQRDGHGPIPTRPALTLARAVKLALAELDQIADDLTEIDGRKSGSIAIGALLLARSSFLPRVLAAFRTGRPQIMVKVQDGTYDDLLAALRRGDIDLLVCALRDPVPAEDVVQETLFLDRMAFVARPGHRLSPRSQLGQNDLAREGWVLPRRDTPMRRQFVSWFEQAGISAPDAAIESGSLLLMRETLAQTDLLGCISGQQAAAEIEKGLIVRLDIAQNWPARAIGLTIRRDWIPSPIQADFLTKLRAAAGSVRQG